MPTARVLITRAMQVAGILFKGEQPAADEANDALTSLNALIDSWSNYSDNIYARTYDTFPLTNALSYTIGAGGDFDTVRPMQIVDAYVTSGGIDYPLSIIDQESYDTISQKYIQSIPQYLVYNNDYPLGKIWIYPVGGSGYTLTLLSEKSVNKFATLDTLMVLPEGWERALIYNLAVELAPEYGQQITPPVQRIALESLGAIKLAVVKSRPVMTNPQVFTWGNIYSGWYNV